MRHFLTLLRNEIWRLLISPSTYIAGFLFLLVMGFLFQWMLRVYTSDPQDETPSVLFFRMFFIPVFFMVPLLTMRSLAEERRSGTIETLLTTPVTIAEIVLAKFSASYLYYCSLWLITASFHIIFFAYAQRDTIIDPYPLIGGYAYIFLSGTLFLSLGIFASSLTKSQLVAGILGFSLVFGFIVIGSNVEDLSVLTSEQSLWLRQFSDHTDALQHMGDFSAGIIDTRAIVLYLSAALTFLFLSVLAIEYRDGTS
ncbi:ABC transporter permease subunit [Pelagicoccus sp. SDUM812005]|uniref:ABC transporter permease n=1 Tax=Pelagicoccus sp. SDUM812005 TaxID=3041257 RepID=UPI00280D0D79|nr:ABC transporter permease subunit [Pelagicoccus sp. SDUM812005]MDQ8182435.1 ABC transporter permease subunit [Pelagicoccus sp. SDUM812005]